VESSVDAVIIGMGYVGLPLAREATAAGLSVIGLDVNPEVVDGLNHGRSPIDDLADFDVGEMLGRGFVATGDASQLRRARTVVICVSTPLSSDGAPELDPLRIAVASVAEHLRPGTLVILESSTYPRTTEEVRPILEAARFIDRGVRTKGTRQAEMPKLLENTYRHINIALVNEMARFCHDLDVDFWVIAAARTKPFGFQEFRPGLGVGGHCIPIDPNYLSHRVRTRLGYPFRFVELA
jgi:UDP-N-acetyl-D-glucosamine dehydrogenase